MRKEWTFCQCWPWHPAEIQINVSIICRVSHADHTIEHNFGTLLCFCLLKYLLQVISQHFCQIMFSTWFDFRKITLFVFIRFLVKPSIYLLLSNLIKSYYCYHFSKIQLSIQNVFKPKKHHFYFCCSFFPNICQNSIFLIDYFKFFYFKQISDRNDNNYED